ncbi:MAG: hypothetical protein Q4B45_07320 [Coriobacteriia bacterium]|nr:hypothetical protein [Coriobacteriia bacterium]
MEKKTYEVPVAELVKFNYKDQVVATSNCNMGYEGNTSNPEGCSPVGYTN